MSRPKKMLPVFEQEREAPRAEADACTDDCCAGEAGSAVAATPATPATREANLEAPDGIGEDGLEKTVVRVEGMDCASCAVTVERRVAALPGMRRATVNFAAGRLDAEHESGVRLEEIESAVRDAGYGVAKNEEVERPPFWRTPRAISVFASASLFALGLAPSLAGAPVLAGSGVYLVAIVVGGCPSSGLRSRGCGPGTWT